MPLVLPSSTSQSSVTLPADPKAAYTARALSLAGISESLLEVFWDPFNTPNAGSSTFQPPWWTSVLGGTGAFNASVTGLAGCSRLSTGGTASSGADTAIQEYMGHSGTGRWYQACRMKLSAVDAATIALQGFWIDGATQEIMIGVYGPTSTGSFIAAYDGLHSGAMSGLVLGPVDTSWHTFEMWCAGDSVLKARMDGGTTVSGSLHASAGADMYPYQLVRNGDTAANRTMDRAWTLIAYESS